MHRNRQPAPHVRAELRVGFSVNAGTDRTFFLARNFLRPVFYMKKFCAGEFLAL
jgi:hypothetical protein